LAASVDFDVVNGVVSMIAGDDAGATMALNGTQLDQGSLKWQPISGGLEMTFRVYMGSISNVAWFIGMTDQASALEMPFTISGTSLTSNATDAVGILFDTDATTDNWKLVGVANNIDAAVQDAGVAPVAGTYEIWKIQITTAGVAKFYRNKVLIGSAMTGAVTPSTLLTPVIAGFSRNNVVKQLVCDFIKLKMKRV